MTRVAQPQSSLVKDIDSYLYSLEFERNASPLTIRDYNHYLSRFLKSTLKKIKNPKTSDISKEIINGYKDDLAQLKLSVKTVGFHLIALRSFLKWMRKNGTLALNTEEIIVPRSESTKINFLSGEDVERLMNAPDLETIQGKRDKAIMELLYSTGLRVSELANLDKKDIDFEKKEILICKNGKEKRTIFLSLRAMNWIITYLNSRKDKQKPLFVHHKGSINDDFRLTVRSIQRAIVKYKKKAGIESEVTPKTLRSSFAVDLLTAGADTKGVQEMLGHKNISTTQIYTHVTNKQLRDIHEAFPGKKRKIR